MGAPGIDTEAQALLTDKDEVARLGALYWMVKYDKATYTPKLMEFLHDKSWHIRAVTAQFAGELGVSKAAPRLIELLNDTNAHVQGNSLHALEQLYKTKAVFSVLDDRRVHATLTIEGKKHEAVIADITLVREVRQGQR
jgi:HEAT repeat protein